LPELIPIKNIISELKADIDSNPDDRDFVKEAHTLIQKTHIPFTFTSTKPGDSGEDKKAEIKNFNLPWIQFMYNGEPWLPLYCKRTNQPGWEYVPNVATKELVQRFCIDFNHIRQVNRKLLGLTKITTPGTSADKRGSPSALFRGMKISNDRQESCLAVAEFMSCMPIRIETHTYITQDSYKSHILFKHFNWEQIPWVLQSKDNFDYFMQFFPAMKIDYDEFVAALNTPNFNITVYDTIKWT
jgi:hypothetical protein